MAPFQQQPDKLRTYFQNLVIHKCTNSGCPYFHFTDSFKILDPVSGHMVINSEVVKKHAFYGNLEDRFIFLDTELWEVCPRCQSPTILEHYQDDFADTPIDILTWSALEWLMLKEEGRFVQLDEKYFGRD